MHYGHEDTLFGAELSDQGIALSHCDNPLFHEGLDEDSIFWKKDRTGIQTLLQLIEEGTLKTEHAFMINIRAYRASGLRLFTDCFSACCMMSVNATLRVRGPVSFSLTYGGWAYSVNWTKKRPRNATGSSIESNN